MSRWQEDQHGSETASGARARWPFLLPAFVVLSVFVALPAALTIAAAFSDLQNNRWVWFQNFSTVFDDFFFWIAARNTAHYVLVTVLVIQGLSILYAISLGGQERRAVILRTLLFLPVLVPFVVAAVQWRWILSENGALNWLLLRLHVISGPIPWLSDPRYALWGAMMATIWKGVGFYAPFYIAANLQLPQDVLEAAAIDGANRRQILRFVTIPLMRPTMLVLILLSFMSAVQVFTEVFLIVDRDNPANATLMIYLYQLAFQQSAIEQAAAVAFVMALILIGASALLWYVMREGGIYSHEE